METKENKTKIGTIVVCALGTVSILICMIVLIVTINITPKYVQIFDDAPIDSKEEDQSKILYSFDDITVNSMISTGFSETLIDKSSNTFKDIVNKNNTNYDTLMFKFSYKVTYVDSSSITSFMVPGEFSFNLGAEVIGKNDCSAGSYYINEVSIKAPEDISFELKTKPVYYNSFEDYMSKVNPKEIDFNVTNMKIRMFGVKK